MRGWESGCGQLHQPRNFTAAGRRSPANPFSTLHRFCPACSQIRHPEVARINFLCASGGQFKAVAAQFGLTQASVHNHFKRHQRAFTSASIVTSW